MTTQIDWHSDDLTLQTRITSSYKTTQNVRRFFAEHIGGDIHFSRPFMLWMKENAGKTLQQAIQYYKSQIK